MTLTNSTFWICLKFYQVLWKTSFLFWLAAGTRCVSYPSRQHCCSQSSDLVSTDSSTSWCQTRCVDVWQERSSLTTSGGSVAFWASELEGSAAFLFQLNSTGRQHLRQFFAVPRYRQRRPNEMLCSNCNKNQINNFTIIVLINNNYKLVQPRKW